MVKQSVRTLCLLTEEILRHVFDGHTERLKSTERTTELSEKSYTTKMWVELILMPTFLIMKFHRASHERDWTFHITTAVAMMPYMFSANHHNNAGYGFIIFNQ